MIYVKGKLFDGFSSVGKAARLSVNEEGSVRLLVDGDEQWIGSDEIEFSSRLGSSMRTVKIVNHGRFETLDNDAVDRFANLIHPKGASALHRLESSLPLICAGIIFTILFVLAFVKVGIPSISDYIVEQLPEKTADILEDKILADIEQRWFSPSKLSEERQEQLQVLFQSVKADLGSDADYKFELYDAEGSVGANALAFPSGKIVMTDQLVDLVSNDDQLAGVMAHEIGHLDGNHSMRQIVRGSLLAFMVAWVSGDVSGASSLVITAPTLLLQMSYSREFETEADGYALKYVGCDRPKLNSMANFFSTLEELRLGKAEDNNAAVVTDSGGHDWGEFLASHPASSKRSLRFQQYYDKNCL